MSSHQCQYAFKGMVFSCVQGKLCNAISFATMESIQVSGEMVMVSPNLDLRRTPSDR